MMSWINDIRYPFGNPVQDRLLKTQTRTAIRNVLKLAEDKIRIARGEGEEILMDDADCILAEQSIQEIVNLIKLADGKEEAKIEENTETH